MCQSCDNVKRLIEDARPRVTEVINSSMIEIVIDKKTNQPYLLVGNDANRESATRINLRGAAPSGLVLTLDRLLPYADTQSLVIAARLLTNANQSK